jgi:alkaline phosphatase D
LQNPSRRNLLIIAAVLGAAPLWSRARAQSSSTRWLERREFFPEGVASGDPDFHSVILWTRRPYQDSRASGRLTVEIAEDPEFKRVVGTTKANALAASDYTIRVLVGGLKPKTEYWYRFTDSEGNGSRIGRTVTAPRDDEDVPARFAVVCCQNVNQGAQNALRRLTYDDRRAAPTERLSFVLHLGDFVYETVWYPEDSPNGHYYGRRLRDVVRFENGEKITNFHIPTTVTDYRALHRAYLHDPDIQDARAYLPFVAMWDNHDFSWQGWQGFERFLGPNVPAQTRKVAANQAWFEYHPGRLGQSLDQFRAPAVTDSPVTQFDEHGLGIEPNNLVAVHSLTGYRALRWGKHLDLLITDQHSYRSEDPMGRDEAKAFTDNELPFFFPEEALIILDGGRAWNGGNPPAQIVDWNAPVQNFQKDRPPVTVLGSEQKSWFLKRLKSSKATWKMWGNTNATLDMRADLQNLPTDFPHWPSTGYGIVKWGGAGSDWSNAFSERGEIYDFIAREKITGFATIAGDRHSFWAGLAAKSLPPRDFQPVGIAFVTGSICTPGFQEIMEFLPKNYPLRPLFISDTGPNGSPEGTVNLLARYGVKTALEYARNGDLAQAKTHSNPDNAPHVSFVDMNGHGYSIVRAGADTIEIEFVCIPRPYERSDEEDGGPVRYRIVHRAKLWNGDQRPALEKFVIEGDVGMSI